MNIELAIVALTSIVVLNIAMICLQEYRIRRMREVIASISSATTSLSKDQMQFLSLIKESKKANDTNLSIMTSMRTTLLQFRVDLEMLRDAVDDIEKKESEKDEESAGC